MKDNLFVAFATLILCGLLAGCGGGAKSPSAEIVRGGLAESFPPYLKIVSVETEATGTPGRYNFKAGIVAREALFIAAPDRSVPLALIRQTQKEGATLTAYGRFTAERVVDSWHIGDVQVTNGLNEVGRPKGDFAGAYIAGTPEVDKIVADLKAKAEQERKEADALAEQQKRARTEKLAQEKKEAEELVARQKHEAAEMVAKQAAEQKVYRERLLAVAKVGKRYVGVLTDRHGSKQSIEMRVIEQSGFTVAFEFRNPDATGEKVLWKGELNFQPTDEKAPIQVSAVERSAHGWSFYSSGYGGGSLAIKFENDGSLTGTGSRDGSYSIRLQPVAD